MKTNNLVLALKESETVEDLKAQLQELADQDFYNNMKDHWTHKDFERDSKIELEIKSIINKLNKLGLEVNYKLGYPIEYKEMEGKQNED